MGTSMTAEQVRDDHLRMLGPTLGPVYYALYNEVAWLHVKWNQYRILFAESEKRVELLNSTAGSFFHVIKKVLWDDVVLHIARLTDPAESPGKNKKNLSLSGLKPFLREPPALVLEIENLLTRAQADASFTRDWRNRHLAHRDLDLVIGKGVTPLDGISRENMERALTAIRAVLNKIEWHYWQGKTEFKQVIVRDDAESLIHYLEHAIEAEKQQQQGRFPSRT
jgi:HEPN superfamily AbiU2-like protein